jgi:hypothetical protein
LGGENLKQKFLAIENLQEATNRHKLPKLDQNSYVKRQQRRAASIAPKTANSGDQAYTMESLHNQNDLNSREKQGFDFNMELRDVHTVRNKKRTNFIGHPGFSNPHMAKPKTIAIN